MKAIMKSDVDENKFVFVRMMTMMMKIQQLLSTKQKL